MSPPRVLFVDDEDDLRIVVKAALSGQALELVFAADGPRALELLQHGPPFTHVVTDVSMPGGVSGFDVANEVLRALPQARVVITSGYQRSQLPPLPPQVQFLPKPYRVRQLLQALAIVPLATHAVADA